MTRAAMVPTDRSAIAERYRRLIVKAVGETRWMALIDVEERSPLLIRRRRV